MITHVLCHSQGHVSPWRTSRCLRWLATPRIHDADAENPPPWSVVAASDPVRRGRRRRRHHGRRARGQCRHRHGHGHRRRGGHRHGRRHCGLHNCHTDILISIYEYASHPYHICTGHQPTTPMPPAQSNFIFLKLFFDRLFPSFVCLKLLFFP